MEDNNDGHLRTHHSPGGYRAGGVSSPPDPCSCHDACPGIYGGEQCNARDADANASTASYLDTGGQSDKYVCGNRLACDVDGDPDRNDGPNRDDSDPATTDARTKSDCGHRAAAHGASGQ